MLDTTNNSLDPAGIDVKPCSFPAPTISTPTSPTSPTLSSSDGSSSNRTKISDLMNIITAIDNISVPLDQHMLFQQSLAPEIRIIIEANQWLLAFVMFRAFIKTFVTVSYSEINNPPAELTKGVGRTQSNIDILGDSFNGSMRQIISLMHSKLVSQ